MEFRETLLAAQRNQQQKSSENLYYKARFDPPKKESKPRDKLSANIQKFLAKKEEEERQKKLDAIKKRDELLAMRDPKAMRKIQKSLKVFRSANKSVLEDAVDHEHTAVTREGPSQPDQDDYGYESQEAAAIYAKMMEKYSKIPDEPKFPTTSSKSKKDLDGTRERVKQALQHEDDPVPHKRRRRNDKGELVEEKDPSPPPQEKKKDEKPKIRRPAPPPMDFNQLLKLAEQKKAEPVLGVAPIPKKSTEPEPERLMTKKQKREYEEEMARRMRRQERLDAEKSGRKVPKEEQRATERERKPEGTPGSGFGRIPKLSDKNSNNRNDSPKSSSNSSSRTDKDKIAYEKERIERLQKERERARSDKERAERDKERTERERTDRDKLDKLKAERERIERDIERLNKDRDRLEKSKLKLESNSRNPEKPVDKRVGSKDQEIKKNIDLKSQNTYRIDKNSNERKNTLPSRSSVNGHSSQGKPVPKDKYPVKDQRSNGNRPENGKKMMEQSKAKARPDDRKPLPSSAKGQPPSKPKIASTFDFDKHVNSLKNGPSGGPKRPNGSGDVKRKMTPEEIKRKQMMMKRRVVDSDSEYDSEMDDFIDDGDAEEDYSKHIKEIFGYDKSKYRNIDDDDDPTMESSFSRQMHEEYVSKKIGILEDLEDMRLEKQMNMKKKKRRIED